MKRIIGIPTLNQYAKCQTLLGSLAKQTLLPHEVCVIDNGARFECERNYPFPVRIVKSEYNFGVSKSWNVLGRMYHDCALLLSNDDIELNSPVILEKLFSHTEPIVCGFGCSFFIIRPEAWQKCGEFDEGIWPGLYEDNDFTQRYLAASCRQKEVREFQHLMAHTGGATCGTTFAGAWSSRQKAYYEDKWGTIGGRRRWDIPWNGKAVKPLDWEFDYRHRTPSDINEHLPKLREIASQSGRVTEFGTRTAVSSIGLLASRPTALTCYDLGFCSETDILKHFCEETHVRLIVGDSRTVDIEPTDFLFIDTDHTYAQVTAELAKSADKVRKYIGFHDTETHGIKGGDGGEGLMKGIMEFLQKNPTWKIEYHTKLNNGLTILKRD